MLVVPLVIVSFYRFYEDGWEPVGYFHICGCCAILGATYYRESLSIAVRSSICIGVIAIAGLSGIVTFGITASSGVYIPFASVFAALILSRRSAITILFVLVVLTVAVVSVFHGAHSESVLGGLDNNWLSPTNIILRLVSWSMLALATIFAIGLITSDWAEMLSTLSEKTKALQSSQQALQGVLDNIVDIVYRTDSEGRFVELSPSVHGLLGFHPEELIGKKISDYYVDPEDRNTLLRLLVENNGTVNNFVAKLYNKAEVPQTLSTNLKYWRSVDGDILGIEGVSRNITEQLETEKALVRSQKTEALGQLTAGIAHDFNNLLAIVMGNAELLLSSSGANDKNREEVREIIKSSQQGAALTRRLLAYSRPDTLTPAITDLDKSIDGLAGMLRSALGANIDLSFDLGKEDTVALIDQNQLETALLNLVINARDAMPKGGEITISSGVGLLTSDFGKANDEQDDLKYVGVWIKDTGSGMTSEVADKIREPFYTSKPPGVGNGLGLSMVDRFVQESSGHLVIETELGKGTSVGLFFPQVYTEVPPVIETQDKPVAEAAAPLKILVVEDSPRLLTLVRRMLDSRGYLVLTAADGLSAIKIATEAPELALIISDIMLPGAVSGWDLYRNISGVRKNIKFLMMTGYSAEEQDEIDVPIVYKPFKQEELLARIDDVLK